MRRSTWMICLFVAAIASRAQATESVGLQRGIELINGFEERKALEVLQNALSEPRLSSHTRAQIYFHIGLAHFELLDRPRSEASFRQALDEDLELAVPSYASPKIVALFETLRHEAREAAQHERPVEAPAIATSALPPSPAVRRGVRNWPAWGLLGGGLALGGVGLGLGLAANHQQSVAQDLNLNYGQAQTEYHSAQREALAANILLGAAATAVAVSAILFIIDALHPPAPARADRVSRR